MATKNADGYWINDPEDLIGTPGPGWFPWIDPNTGKRNGWTNGKNGYIEEGKTLADAESWTKAPDQHHGAAKLMKPVVLGSLAAMAGAGAAGAMGFGPAAGMGPNLLTGAGEAAGAAGSTGAGGLLGGTPEVTEAMLAGANATSDPIAYLAAQQGGAWGAVDPAYLSTLSTVGGTAAGSWLGDGVPVQAPSQTPKPKGLLSGLPDWLKLALTGAGAYGLYKDAANKNGQPTGYQPSLDKGAQLLGSPQYKPTYTTKLSSAPQYDVNSMYIPQSEAERRRQLAQRLGLLGL